MCVQKFSVPAAGFSAQNANLPVPMYKVPSGPMVVWFFTQLTALYVHCGWTLDPVGPFTVVLPVWRMSCWNIGHGVAGLGPVVTSNEFALVTVNRPLVALAGTIAVIFFAVFTVNSAFNPLNFTELEPVMPPPVITTVAPTEPLPGVNPVIFRVSAPAGAGRIATASMATAA